MPKKGGGKGGGIAAYNAIISAIKSRTGVSHKEAQQTYRAASVRLGKPPSLTEARRGAAVKAEAARAGKQIAAAKAAKWRAADRAAEKRHQEALAKIAKRKDKEPVDVKPPAGGGGILGGGGGGGGGAGGGPGGGGQKGPGTDYDPDWAGLEPPDEFGGDDGDYVPD